LKLRVKIFVLCITSLPASSGLWKQKKAIYFLGLPHTPTHVLNFKFDQGNILNWLWAIVWYRIPGPVLRLEGTWFFRFRPNSAKISIQFLEIWKSKTLTKPNFGKKVQNLTTNLTTMTLYLSLSLFFHCNIMISYFRLYNHDNWSIWVRLQLVEQWFVTK